MIVPNSKHQWLICSGRFTSKGISGNSRRRPAYVAFTSGETGEPKGVLCCHGPMTHFLPWQETRFITARTIDSVSVWPCLQLLAARNIYRVVARSDGMSSRPEIVESRLTNRLVTAKRNHNSSPHPGFSGILRNVHGPAVKLGAAYFLWRGCTYQTNAGRPPKACPNAKITNLYGVTETQRASGYFEIPEGILSQNRCKGNCSTRTGG